MFCGEYLRVKHLSVVKDTLHGRKGSLHEKIDFVEVDTICRRLFANRRLQPWPCEIVPSVEWRESYISMCRGMEALRSFDDAVKWADSLIVEISTSKPTI